MNMYEIITKKKRGEELSDCEIEEMIKGYTRGDIPDYQMSALMMAICFRGMTDREIGCLTQAMANSGDTIDLSDFGDLTVDKHSTGGVGDKTTPIVAPIAAALGCKVAKISGRGLGHTGGTVDKLESFDGYRTSLSPEEFKSQVEKVGIAVIGQSADLAPADKKLYALRDVTATVDSIPLITSSIMSKKLAAGSHSIVLDVKYGSGSFMKTPEDAQILATKMVEIGKSCGRRMAALITSMDIPLGHAIGNSLEIKEAVSVLRGEGPEDLRRVCIALATEMVSLSLGKSPEEATADVLWAIRSGAALRKFEEWIIAQGGSADLARNPDALPCSPYSADAVAAEDGYVVGTDAERIGAEAVTLGAGRKTKDDLIDSSAGIVLLKKPGDKVSRGDVLAKLYSSDSTTLDKAAAGVCSAIRISADNADQPPLIYKIIR